MTYLLDVNVLIALIDPGHVANDAAHRWFEQTGKHDWASCPITQNGVVRILGHQRYPNSAGSPAAAAEIMMQMTRLAGHRFWPDEISLLANDAVDTARLLVAGQVTDTYLIALSKHNGGKLATFDRRISSDAVAQGRAYIHQIDGA